MLGTALYYPHIDIEDLKWLRSAVLFWDEIQTIAPTSIQTPYQNKDTIICEEEEYLRPLHCDLHPDVLRDLGQRVVKLMEELDSELSMSTRRNGPVHQALLRSEELSQSYKREIKEAIGFHPDELPADVRSFVFQPGGLKRLWNAMPERLSTGKLDQQQFSILSDTNSLRRNPEQLSYLLPDITRDVSHDEDGSWLTVDGRFAEIYMSALASLLARDVGVSPLTNEVASSGVGLRCLVDEIVADGPTLARGALVSIVMESLNIDPEVPIQKILAFRRKRRDQLAELSGKFDNLKSSIENSTNREEIEDGTRRIFENDIRPSLSRLKRELRDESIASAWKGFQAATTLSIAPSAALLAFGAAVPIALGASAFVTFSGIGIHSFLTRSKTHVGSPYSYLLDIERKFSH